MRLFTETEVRERLSVAVDKAGGQKAFAESLELSPSAIGNVLKQGKKPSPKIVKAIGFEPCESLWRKTK